MKKAKSVLHGFRRYIKELQKSDDKRKRRWLVVTTTIIMVCVFTLWVLYLNITLPHIAGKERLPNKSVKSESFFQTFSRGLKAIALDLQDKFNALKDQLVKRVERLEGQLKSTNEFYLETGTSSTPLP